MANDEWVLVERLAIAADATTKDFTTVLSGNTDLGYKIKASIVRGTTTNAATNYGLRVNGASMAANRRYISASSTTVSTAATAASILTLGLGTNANATLEGGMEYTLNYARTGYERFWRFWGSRINSNTDWQEEFIGTLRMTTPNTATDITSLGIVADQTGGIGANSILELYKKGA